MKTKEELLSAFAGLATGGDASIDCAYCTNCAYCIDCANCAYCIDCANCAYCADCAYCTNCAYCADCTNCAYCADCILCKGLKGKYSGYYLLNKEVTKEEFEAAKGILK